MDVLEQPLEHEIDPDVQQELMQYPGKWAALTRSEVISIDDSVAGVLRLAKNKGYVPAEVILYLVPLDGDTVYFL